ncbi:MAG: signal peptidase I [Bacteroidetes bacterium]|nr:signal peptidase I [Bacteroidota bacterium]
MSFLKNIFKKRKPEKPPEGFVEHVWSWVKTFAWALTVVTIVNGLALASFVVPTGSMESTVMTGDFLFVNKFKYGPSTPQIIPFFNIPLPYYKTPPIWAPEQGDVIVFIFPGNRDQVKPDNFEYYLKRCVAVAGDVLEVKGGRVIVNGKEFPLPEHGQFMQYPADLRQNVIYPDDRIRTFPPGRGYTRDDYGPIRIPKEGDVLQLNQQNFQEWATFIAREGHQVDAMSMTIDGQRATSYTVERDYVFGMGDNRDNSLDSRFWGFIPKQDVVGTPIMVYWSMPVSDPNSRDQEPLSLKARIKGIRWSRLGTIIR